MKTKTCISYYITTSQHIIGAHQAKRQCDNPTVPPAGSEGQARTAQPTGSEGGYLRESRVEFDKEINPVNQAIELALNLCYGKRKELQRLGGLSRVTWPETCFRGASGFLDPSPPHHEVIS